MSVEGCWRFDFFTGIRTCESIKLEKKRNFATGGFDPRTFRVQKRSCTTALQWQYYIMPDFKRQILLASEMIFHFEKAILFIRFRVFVIFSKIPRGIWKISFYMLSYICILSKNHSRSLLNFFLIGTPTLNRVPCKDILFKSSRRTKINFVTSRELGRS